MLLICIKMYTLQSEGKHRGENYEKTILNFFHHLSKLKANIVVILNV